MNLSRLAIVAGLAEDTSSSSKIRTPAVGATQKICLVYSNILSLELLNRGGNFDRVGTSNKGRKGGSAPC